MAEVASLAKIMGRMTDLEHQDVEKDFIGTIYGSTGTGKTTLVQGIAQSLRGDGQILYLDSSDGWVSLENFPRLLRNTTRLAVTDPRELMVLAQALKTRKKGFSDFTVVVLDEVSSWFEVILHNYVREVTGTLPTQDLPEIEGKMYAAPTQAFLNIINVFHQTEGLHILMVAHEQERGQEGGRKIITPSLPPKLMQGLAQKVHLVGRLESVISREGYVRELQVQPSKQVMAKTRIGKLDVKIPFNSVPKKIKEWVGTDRMAGDIIEKHPDPEPVADEDVDTEEVETADYDEDDAVEVTDDE